jgi:NADP-dependent 3-hydroxy acid dehydrogenase YdfG
MFSKSMQELMSPKGKIDVITGAAAGMGEAISYRYTEAGCDLHLIDVDKEKLDKF